LAIATAVLAALPPILLSIRLLLMRGDLMHSASLPTARAVLAFLVVQWHGERSRRPAYRRPGLLMLIFGLALLAGSLLTAGIFSGLQQALAYHGAVPLKLVFTLLSAPLNLLEIWLSWWLAAWLLRNDALPPAPQPNLRLRAAGLIAWLLALGLTWFAPFWIAFLTMLTDDAALSLFGYWTACSVPMLLAFGGSLLGLPPSLREMHMPRLLGAALAAMATLAGLGYGLLYLIEVSPLSYAALPTAVTVALWLVLLLLGVPACYGLWTWLFYAGLPRGGEQPPVSIPPPLPV
jgi:hypothetical protein